LDRGNKIHVLTIIDPPVVTVDPYSTEYWAKPETTTKIKSAGPHAGLLSTSRPALVDKTKQMNGIVTATLPLKAARMVTSEDLEAFKMAIDGQDLTKIAMIEHLKKMWG
jgi:chromatin assembly factor 1 subunit A